jgi:putative peptidoglycan lipid II flippase
MVKALFWRANKSFKIGTAAWLLAGSYFASAVLGLMRDRLLAARFGLDATLDAYFAAFSIPDLMFYLLVSGALAVTFIPVFSERLAAGNKKAAWELSSSLINFLGIVTLIGSIVIFAFADPLMWLVAPAFDQNRHDLAVNLTRILALNPFLFSISSVYASMQQAFGRFFFYALAPVLYNLGIIFGIIFLSPEYGITGVAIGVIGGAVAQLIIQRLGLAGLGFNYQTAIFWRNESFKKVLRLMVPRSFDEAIEHLNAVVERAIASGLAVGSVAAYQYAFNLKNMPVTLIGTAIATAAFPKISNSASINRVDLVKKQLMNTAQLMLWLLIPVAALMVVLRGYVVRLLFGFGDPTTAAILGWFAAAIVFQSLLRLVSRVFYAYQDTKTPLYVSIAAIGLNIIVALMLVRVYGVSGLAMAQSIVATFEISVLLLWLRRRLGSMGEKKFILYGLKITLASVIAATVTYLVLRFYLPLLSGETGFWRLAPKFSILLVVGVGTYLIVGYLLKLSESKTVMRKINNFVFKRYQLNND